MTDTNGHDIGHLAHELYAKFVDSFKPGARASATAKPTQDFISKFKYEQGPVSDPNKLEEGISYANAVAGIAYLGTGVEIKGLTPEQKQKYAEVGNSLMDKMGDQGKSELIRHIQEGETEQIVAKYAEVIRNTLDPKLVAAKNIQRSEGGVQLETLKLLSQISDGGKVGDTVQKWYRGVQDYISNFGNALRYNPPDAHAH